MKAIVFVLLLTSVAAVRADTIKILFLGNSHTATGNVPEQVKVLLAKPGRIVEAQFISCGLLQDIGQNDQVQATIKSGKFDVVVLQGAGLSQSHKYVYPTDGAVTLAKLARDSGARALLFAEWSRAGIDETQYTLGIYESIAKASKAEIVPVCRAFDQARKKDANLVLLSSDGNHSNPVGAYLASCTLATAIDPKAPLNYVANGVSTMIANMLKAVARETKVIPPK